MKKNQLFNKDMNYMIKQGVFLKEEIKEIN